MTLLPAALRLFERIERRQREQQADMAELRRLMLCGAEEEPAGHAVEEKLTELREACIARGLAVTGDGFVSEKVAAKLLNRSWRTLRNRRKADEPIAWRASPMSGRPEYYLFDLAAYLCERADGDSLDL